MGTRNHEEPEKSSQQAGSAQIRTAQSSQATTEADRAEVLDDLKEEVAEEVGVDPDRYGGNVPAKKWGALGGHMVKRLIERGEEAMAEDGQTPGDPPRA